MNNQDCPFRTPPTSGFPMSRERADWFFVSKNRDASQIHKDGVRVIGPNTSNGDITAWWFPNEELANHFAKILASDTKQTVLVVSLLGLWKPTEPPVEHVTFAEGQEK